MEQVTLPRDTVKVLLAHAEGRYTTEAEIRLAIGDVHQVLYGNDQVEGQLTLW